MATDKIYELLGDQAKYLLEHKSKTISKDQIHLPSGNFVDENFVGSNRNIPTLRSLQQLYGNGRLANTGYMSILPIDQGIEHSAGASFAPNPLYFDPGAIQARIDEWSKLLEFHCFEENEFGNIAQI